MLALVGPFFDVSIAINLGKQLIALIWLPCGLFADCYLVSRSISIFVKINQYHYIISSKLLFIHMAQYHLLKLRRYQKRH